MNAYTISNLAEDASVSIHMIRDYELRGLLQPCKFTDSGYRIYDEHTLSRLQFVIAGKEAGIPLHELAKLCKAMDEKNKKTIKIYVDRIHGFMECAMRSQSFFKQQLNKVLI